MCTDDRWIVETDNGASFYDKHDDAMARARGWAAQGKSVRVFKVIEIACFAGKARGDEDAGQRG